MEEQMKISVYTMAVDSFAPMMDSFAAILDKAIAYEASSGKDLVNASLAPDMYSLNKQVQIFCHMAADCVARLTGQAPLEYDPLETTLAGLKQQIERTAATIRNVAPEEFDDAEERDCSIAFPGVVIDMDGLERLRSFSLPNFYFHLVTAYGILRSQGLEIGKYDYMSKAGLRSRQVEEAEA
jgi:hypothetical protein